jgi:hypothetical protein
MKTATALLLKSGLIVIIMTTLLPLTFAADIRTAPAVSAALPTKADLAVTGIFATSCKCDLPEFDMFFMNDISVEISKKDISTPAAARTEPSVVVGTLIVTYQNPITGREEKRNVMFQNSNLNTSTGTASLKIFMGPVLVKKSVGVKAEIFLNAPNYAATDPNAANNVMIKKACEVMLR